jgi:hypothetical protein
MAGANEGVWLASNSIHPLQIIGDSWLALRLPLGRSIAQCSRKDVPLATWCLCTRLGDGQTSRPPPLAYHLT